MSEKLLLKKDWKSESLLLLKAYAKVDQLYICCFATFIHLFFSIFHFSSNDKQIFFIHPTILCPQIEILHPHNWISISSFLQVVIIYIYYTFHTERPNWASKIVTLLLYMLLINQHGMWHGWRWVNKLKISFPYNILMIARASFNLLYISHVVVVRCWSNLESKYNRIKFINYFNHENCQFIKWNWFNRFSCHIQLNFNIQQLN